MGAITMFYKKNDVVRRSIPNTYTDCSVNGVVTKIKKNTIVCEFQLDILTEIEFDKKTGVCTDGVEHGIIQLVRTDKYWR